MFYKLKIKYVGTYTISYIIKKIILLKKGKKI